MELYILAAISIALAISATIVTICTCYKFTKYKKESHSNTSEVNFDLEEGHNGDKKLKIHVKTTGTKDSTESSEEVRHGDENVNAAFAGGVGAITSIVGRVPGGNMVSKVAGTLSDAVAALGSNQSTSTSLSQVRTHTESTQQETRTQSSQQAEEHTLMRTVSQVQHDNVLQIATVLVNETLTHHTEHSAANSNSHPSFGAPRIVEETGEAPAISDVDHREIQTHVGLTGATSSASEVLH